MKNIAFIATIVSALMVSACNSHSDENVTDSENFYVTENIVDNISDVVVNNND